MAKNLIVIIADTCRADHLGCYGNTRVKTPQLDKLAAEGVTFTNCYADGLPTIPCRRVLHTGKSIVPMKVHGGWIPLQPGRQPVGQILSNNGFTTGFVVDTYHHFKPGLNFHQGYSSWEWVRGQESDPYRSGPREKFDPKQHMPEHLWNENYDERMRQYMMNTQDFKNEKDWFCASSMRAGLQWVKENAGADRFMLWIDTFDPHEPWDAPPKYKKMYRDDYGYERFMFGYGVRNADIKPEDYPLIQDLYAAEVSFVDNWVGHLVEGLRDMGLLDETVILFSTDHGTHLGEEGCVQKTPGLLNSCVAQLPLIVRHPDQSLAGKRVDALVHATDYMPSMLDMLGVEHKLDLDGESFLPLMTGEKDALHEFVITEFGSNAAVRDLEWHYHQDAKNKDWLQSGYVKEQAEKIAKGGPGVPHLYDLKNDPDETKNVALENPEAVEKAQGRLRELYGV